MSQSGNGEKTIFDGWVLGKNHECNSVNGRFSNGAFTRLFERISEGDIEHHLSLENRCHGVSGCVRSSKGTI